MNKKKKTVGMRIREARLEKGWTVVKLAEYLKISTAQVNNYEKGANTPSFARMAKIADAFDISLDWFALGIEEGEE